MEPHYKLPVRLARARVKCSSKLVWMGLKAHGFSSSLALGHQLRLVRPTVVSSIRQLEAAGWAKCAWKGSKLLRAEAVTPIERKRAYVNEQQHHAHPGL